MSRLQTPPVLTSAHNWGRKAAEDGRPRTAPYSSVVLSAAWCEGYDRRKSDIDQKSDVAHAEAMERARQAGRAAADAGALRWEQPASTSQEYRSAWLSGYDSRMTELRGVCHAD